MCYKFFLNIIIKILIFHFKFKSNRSPGFLNFQLTKGLAFPHLLFNNKYNNCESSVILLPFPFDCSISVRRFTVVYRVRHIPISQLLGWKHGGVCEVIAVGLRSVLLRGHNVRSNAFNVGRHSAVTPKVIHTRCVSARVHNGVCIDRWTVRDYILRNNFVTQIQVI